MPRIPNGDAITDDDLAAAREEFETGFRRSRRGNLSRDYDGRTLTVFKRRDGLYAFVVGDADGPRFSQHNYEYESDAIGGLWDSVGW